MVVSPWPNSLRRWLRSSAHVDVRVQGGVFEGGRVEIGVQDMHQRKARPLSNTSQCKVFLYLAVAAFGYSFTFKLCPHQIRTLICGIRIATLPSITNLSNSSAALVPQLLGFLVKSRAGNITCEIQIIKMSQCFLTNDSFSSGICHLPDRSHRQGHHLNSDQDSRRPHTLRLIGIHSIDIFFIDLQPFGCNFKEGFFDHVPPTPPRFGRLRIRDRHI